MTDDRKQRMESARQEIGLRLDGLFGELGKALNEVVGRLDEAGAEVRHTHSFTTGDKPVQAHADIRFRVGGLEGAATSAPPRAAAEPASPAAPPPREINATILQDAGHWSLTAEVPGVAEEDLKLEVGQGRITLSATGTGARYAGTFDAPATLTRDAITVSLRNGILDLSAEIGGET